VRGVGSSNLPVPTIFAFQSAKVGCIESSFHLIAERQLPLAWYNPSPKEQTMPRQDVKGFLAQLKRERAELDAAIAAIERRFGARSASASAKPTGKSRPMSEETKRKLSRIMKAKMADRTKAAAKK
jgi:hypothetical protein